LEVFAPDDVVPAGRLVRPCRAAGVGQGGLGSTVQSDSRARRSRDNITILFVDCCPSAAASAVPLFSRIALSAAASSSVARNP
jgi:hypothetical protein